MGHHQAFTNQDASHFGQSIIGFKLKIEVVRVGADHFGIFLATLGQCILAQRKVWHPVGHLSGFDKS